MPQRKKRVDKPLVGAAGVFAVCAELNRLGVAAMPTTRSTKAIDVLVQGTDGVQVKTSQSPNGEFMIAGTKVGSLDPVVIKEFFHQRLLNDFVFVLWLPAKRPRFFVVPRDKVVDLVCEWRLQWMKQHPRTTWNATKLGLWRVTLEQVAPYENRWNLLFAGTEQPGQTT